MLNRKKKNQSSVRSLSDQEKFTAGDADSFLRAHGMHKDQICPDTELEKFMNALEKDWQQRGRSGRMIPAYIGRYQVPDAKKTVTVIDIGGTNVRSARITLSADGIQSIDNLQAFPNPGAVRQISTASFFDEIAEGIRSNLTNEEIGICFSLAAIPQKDRDAVIVAGGKQIRITDMLGKKVGESFRQALCRKCLPNTQRITVINDTIAAALGGRTSAPFSREEAGSFSSYIGFIYGTGINLCYQEPTGELVNTEAGSYCTFHTGDIDDRFDAGTIDPGLDRIEKMVSGGYQGGLMMLLLQTAASEGLLGRETGIRLQSRVPVLTARDISIFSNEPDGHGKIASLCADKKDQDIIQALCNAMTDRSARICSIMLTSVLLRCGEGKSEDRPVFITAEGSTYLGQKDFSRKLEQNMQRFAARQHGLHYEIHTVSDVILRGTAAACLSE